MCTKSYTWTNTHPFIYIYRFTAQVKTWRTQSLQQGPIWSDFGVQHDFFGPQTTLKGVVPRTIFIHYPQDQPRWHNWVPSPQWNGMAVELVRCWWRWPSVVPWNWNGSACPPLHSNGGFRILFSWSVEVPAVRTVISGSHWSDIYSTG